MSKDTLLAIDLGTSSVKVLLMKASGQILDRAVAEYPLNFPRTNHVEQTPENWWRATKGAVAQVVEHRYGEIQNLAAVGLSGQMHGTLLLDHNGGLLNPAVIWPDRRSEEQAVQLTEQLGRERLIEITGSPVSTGFQAATLLWFRQIRPEIWDRVATVLLPKDYLRWRLTGGLFTDPSDASGTLLFDVHKRVWSGEILEAIGLRREQLPQVIASTDVAGTIKNTVADELGLPAGLPVITGAADTACALVGAGVIDDQTLLLTIGSGGQVINPAMTAAADLKGRIHTFCGPFPPSATRPGWYQMGAILTAGLALRWLRDNIFGLKSEDAYTRLASWAEGTAPGARGLLFVPYLAGERTPIMDPQARGMFLGLTVEHGRAEMVRAVMEGVALACYDAYSVLVELGAAPKLIHMAGGGVRSPLWQHIFADVFDLPVHPLPFQEQSAFGAGRLAGIGVGLLVGERPSVEQPEVDPDVNLLPVNPDPGRTSLYRRMLKIYRQAYAKHRRDFSLLEKLT